MLRAKAALLPFPPGTLHIESYNALGHVAADAVHGNRWYINCQDKTGWGCKLLLHVTNNGRQLEAYE